MRYARIIAEVLNTPWAIADHKFDAIAQVLARCEAGERLSEDEIRERVGERKVQAQPWVFNCEKDAIYESESFGAAIEAATKDLKANGGSSSSQKLTAVLPIYGILVNRVASLDISETGTGVDRLQALFRQALANPDIRAIVLDFDSPGGSVYGIDEFAQEIFDASEAGDKKIVAQINPLAASAAYYLASQAQEIAITPSGEAGSIGVRSMHGDFSKAMEQRGIKVTHISAGKFKTEGNPHEPLSEDGRAFMQQRVNEYYDMFVKAVARGRQAKASDVRNGFGEGRVLGAAEAKKQGMVDRIATLDETLQRLGSSANSSRVPMAASATATALSVPSAIADGSSITAQAENTAIAENQTEVVMEPQATGSAASADAIRASAVLEAERCERITQLATMHGLSGKLAGWLKSGAAVSTVQDEILTSLRPQAVRQPSAEESRITVVTDEADKLPKGTRIGRFVRAVGMAHRMRMSPVKVAHDMFKDPVLAGFFAAANPQDSSSVAGGGFLIPDVLANEVVEFLRPMAVVRSMNPSTAPLVNGQLSLPKITGGVVANYIGENKPITPSKITGGQVKATAKKLAALIPVSNDLLRFASQSADVLVRDDAVRAIAQIEDISFIRGAGTNYSPKGLLNWALAAGQIAANGTVNVTNTITDLGKLWTQLANNFVRFIRPGFLIAPRTYTYLFNLAFTNGQWVFRDEMRTNKTINGYPFAVTAQIPINLGGSNSEIYFVDFADVVICDAPIVSVEVSTEASYDDGSGNLTSAFSNDQTVIRMIVEHDLIVRHQESIAVLTGVSWT